jgi:hypothetical protein
MKTSLRGLTMRETILTTLLYKYNPYARFVFFLYASSILVLYLFTCDKVAPYLINLGLCVMLLPLVYGAISKKSVFNFRAWDSRLLTLTSSYIQIGKQRFQIADVKLELHVHAYDGFLYRVRRNGLLVPQSTYGDNNVLYIQHNGENYDVEFLLRDYDSYIILCRLIDEWKDKNVPITVKEIFNRDFVRKQNLRRLRKKRTYYGF